MLRHPNIVIFEDCFEDDENVYMVLELCEHGVSDVLTTRLSGMIQEWWDGALTLRA